MSLPWTHRALPATDAHLVRGAAKGDQRAFERIFKRYHQELYRYCRAVLGDPDDAQDALQGTMASILRSLPGESRSIELRPWLYRIAHNESISVMRRRADTLELGDEGPPGLPADITAENREELRELVADLERLPERQRSALVLKELSGLSAIEIAEALGTSPQAARQAVYEARSALHELKEGRDMSCDDARRAISDGDGRRLRGRRMRAHLRDCAGCSAFMTAIGERRALLPALVPPIPMVAASGVLASAMGATGAGTGSLAATSTAGVAGGSLALKAAGVVAAGAVATAGIGSLANKGSGDGSPKLPDAIDVGGSAPSPTGRRGAPVAAPATTRNDAGPRGERRAGSRRQGGRGRSGQSEAPNARERGTNREAPAAPIAAPGQGSTGGSASGAAQAEPGRPATPPGSAGAIENSNGNANVPATGSPEHAQQAGPPDHPSSGGKGRDAAGIAETEK